VAYGFDPSRDVTVVVGDTKRDVTAGRDGGARVIAVATGMDSREDLDRSGADVALASLVDVSAFCRAVDAVRTLGPLSGAVR
jgi:phosphoglycolate phosphatase-like HAD superfamily hydrolase